VCDAAELRPISFDQCPLHAGDAIGCEPPRLSRWREGIDEPLDQRRVADSFEIAHVVADDTVEALAPPPPPDGQNVVGGSSARAGRLPKGLLSFLRTARSY
jgi:hypothetical protein